MEEWGWDGNGMGVYRCDVVELVSDCQSKEKKGLMDGCETWMDGCLTSQESEQGHTEGRGSVQTERETRVKRRWDTSL